MQDNSILDKFVGALKKVYGERLVSAVLYGSSVSGNFVPGVSDLNVLVILRDRDPQGLLSLGKGAGGLIRRHRITPLVMAKEEFLNSSDVFPMEYLELQACHKVLFGPDVVDELEISPAHLRHQLEDRLRGMMNSLRQIGIKVGGRKKPLTDALSRWSGAVIVVFKGYARLVGEDPGRKSPEELIHQMTRRVSMDEKPFLDVLRLREGGFSGNAEDLLVNLLNGVARLSDAVDGMEGSL